MSARTAISSIDAAWKPRSANTSPATSSICSSRTARGTSRVPARRFSDRAIAETLFPRHALEPLELPAEGLLHPLVHDDAEHRGHRLGGQRPQPLQRLAHLRPALRRPAGGVE